ncbi:hypothetical protein ACFPM3_28660 [Streptomyces coeruleoprunus]|uniref:SH3 domain-containing protein n=1 Tax=Streptomyces coeruleoprunus TaxID=285563 RepID=A0ABV9XM84_9ACTN
MIAPKYRHGKAVAAGILAVAGVMGTAGAASASAPAAAPALAPASVADVRAEGGVQAQAYYTRTIWKRVNQRVAPTNKSRLMGTLGPTPHTVKCWRYGQTVKAEGHVNNVWIYVKNKASGKWGYASAIYFKGNKYANLPKSAKC